MKRKAEQTPPANTCRHVQPTLVSPPLSETVQAVRESRRQEVTALGLGPGSALLVGSAPCSRRRFGARGCCGGFALNVIRTYRVAYGRCNKPSRPGRNGCSWGVDGE